MCYNLIIILNSLICMTVDLIQSYAMHLYSIYFSRLFLEPDKIVKADFPGLWKYMHIVKWSSACKTNTDWSFNIHGPILLAKDTDLSALQLASRPDQCPINAHFYFPPIEKTTTCESLIPGKRQWQQLYRAISCRLSSLPRERK